MTFTFTSFIFGCAGSSLLHRLSLAVASGAYSPCGVQASHCGTSLVEHGLSNVRAQLLWLRGSRAQAR